MPAVDAPGAGTAFPWDEALGAGLGLLHLAPAEFWAMTPQELAAALGFLLPKPGQTLSRPALDALMARFPDGHR
ncbi:rcc01693 family protein [Consotaella salsifontis]|uniref:rcc01693 family protein n=1 Tax=Consotaella salsifontis TaxID=1365950 RepID=UPI00099AD83C